MSEHVDEIPALLGGPAIRPQGPPAWPVDDGEVTEALNQLARDGGWGRYHGPHCKALIDQLKSRSDCAHALLCSSGTGAVELALRGLRIGPGDDVIMSAYDFKANFGNILAVGARPVLVDLNSSDYQLDVEQLSRAVSDTTKAVIASHLHGCVVDMPGVMTFAQQHGLGVIEDACQMTGATVYGSPAGTWGDVGILSFGGSKLLTAGRGGAVLTNRADIAQRVRLYAARGNDAYPLSEMQAAVLRPQVDRLDERNALRVVRVRRLRERFMTESGLEVIESQGAESEPAYYKVGFKYDPTQFSDLPRERFSAAMRAEGIAIDPGFRSLHLIHGRSRFRAVGDLPVATEADARILTLHHPVLLEDASAIDEIVAALEKIRRHATMLLKGES